jgi:DNA-binding NtrC family response regulator
VITIATPTLRQHKEDIPGLVHCFLLEASSFLQREPMQISHGALDKIMQYDWPGNVRELKNCITRAMIFAEGDILLARHIVLEDMGEQEYESIPLPVKNADTGEIRNPDHNSSEQPAVSSEILDSLNARQKKVWPAIAASGEISRALYQELLEEDISIRTAQYDLQDLVNKGLLKKIGRGPASRYVIAKNR